MQLIFLCIFAINIFMYFLIQIAIENIIPDKLIKFLINVQAPLTMTSVHKREA